MCKEDDQDLVGRLMVKGGERVSLSWDELMDRLADKFRGPMAHIAENQRARYFDVVHRAYLATGKPILDIGCGRGEWLTVLQQSQLPARGVELNEVQVTRLRTQGLDVLQADALDYLRETRAGSYSVITAFQVVEHWPAPLVWEAVNLAHQAHAADGVLILETVNVSSVWAWNNFALDPTHVTPFPPELLHFMVGFSSVRVEYYAPLPAPYKFVGSEPVWHLANEWLFGPQDYAVFAYK